MLAVPTGSIKEYAFLQMLASIRNVDYPADRLALCFCLTDRGGDDEKAYLGRCHALILNAAFKNPVKVLETRFDNDEFQRWSQYVAVIRNLHEARKLFLDGDWDYFWLLGGDNPPLRDTLKRLMAAGADVTGAIINQRPLRGREGNIVYDGKAFYEMSKTAIYPIYWGYTFTPREIRARKDLDPRVRTALLQAWTNLCYFQLRGSPSGGVLRDVNFGSGCLLVKRKVLEHIGWYLGAGYHSEDIAFGQLANLYGFDVALDTSTPCPHFDPNGMIY